MGFQMLTPSQRLVNHTAASGDHPSGVYSTNVEMFSHLGGSLAKLLLFGEEIT